MQNALNLNQIMSNSQQTSNGSLNVDHEITLFSNALYTINVPNRRTVIENREN